MSKKVFFIAIISFIVDQISKCIISTYIDYNSSIVIIKNFFYLRYINNTGASWGILSNKQVLLILFSIIAIILIIRYMYSFKDTKVNRVGFGLLLGGIIGNLCDRVFFGYVKDFFDFYIFKYDYPVFNFADIFIVVGVLLLIISIIKGDDKNGSNSKR